MREAIRRWVEGIWYPVPNQPIPFFDCLCFLALLPFSILYTGISLLIQYSWALRNYFKPGYRARVPVIIVGNFTVGGTGKTPLVAYLCEQLKRQGWQPGIISRGYGRNKTGVQVVTKSVSPKAVGDEAMLLFDMTQQPTVVASSRNQAIKTLLSDFPSVDVIISDDGLQHAGLHADLRIAVVDALRGLGNGWCLPAGPLRAPLNWGQFGQVDIEVINETAMPIQNTNTFISTEYKFPMRFNVVGFSKMNMGAPYRADTPTISVTDFLKIYSGRQLHAVAGIGNPSVFFDSLERMGLSILRHAYPDHHAFKLEDLIFENPETIIMTEKDAVKCAPLLSDRDCWVLKIRVTIEEHFLSKVVQSIRHAQPLNKEQ